MALNIAEQAIVKQHYGKFPDFYSKTFERTADRIARFECKPRKDDLYLLGYFTDDELWSRYSQQTKHSILIDYLNFPSEAAGHQHVLQFLTQLYPTIQQLNEAWNIEAETYQQLASFERFPPSTQRMKDEAEFLYQTAKRYFEICHNAIIKSDINHMILGVRFSGSPSKPVLQSSRGYVDIISLNFCDRINQLDSLREIHKITERPIMITDYYYKTLKSNSSTSFQRSEDQDQSNQIKKFLTELMRFPFVVGYHIFDYTPTSSKNVSESYYQTRNLVTIQDNPRKFFNDTISEFNKTVETIHSHSMGYSKP